MSELKERRNRQTKERPKWIEPLLQGLSFWMGYKKQLFRNHSLTEGAIVSECLQLIYMHLKDDQRVNCEFSYADILKKKDPKYADIAILKDKIIECVIEVKRAESKSLIKQDILKLSEVKQINKKVRCFVLLASQGRRPTKYVDKNGKAIRGLRSSNGVKYKIVRVCKAASSFNSVRSSNYACLIEIID